MSGAPLIKIRHVSKHFAHRAVLEDVCLDLEGEKTHVFLGPSGCGKSTMLRLLIGLLPFDQGEIIIDDIKVGPNTQRKIAERIGYVVQEGGLFPHLSIAGNLSLPARARKWKKTKIQSRIDELCSLAGLEAELLPRFPSQLSGGQRQRVSLMRALMLDPMILVFDEPFGALDPIARKTLQQELKLIFNQVKKTVIIVTHDLGEAAFFGHSISLFNDKTVVQQGSLQDLLHHPSDPFVTEFMNAQRGGIQELLQ